MTFVLLLVGLLLPGHVSAQDLQGKTLYEYIHKQVKQSEHVSKVELPVERFTAGAYYENPVDSEMNILESDVDKAAFDDISQLCGDKEADRETCRQIQGQINEISTKTNWFRQLARDLQMIAAGYETGLSDYPGHGVNIMSRLPSITHIWKGTNDSYTTPVLGWSAAGKPIPPNNADAVNDRMQELIQLLRDLVHESGEKKDESEMIAAVWRYKNGVEYLKNLEGNCSNDDPSTSELMFLKKRWCAVEDKLKEIHKLVVDPYIQSGDIPPEDFVLFPTIVDDDSNIVVWIRMDDVGMEWNFPIEPVQLQLYTRPYINCVESGAPPQDCNDGYSMILGGTYTDEVPEPAENEGICSHPFSKNGYLCRKLEDTECLSDLSEANEEGILLTKCEPEQFRGNIGVSPSGPDLCEIGGWRTNAPAVNDGVVDTPEKQSGPGAQEPKITPDVCSSCAVDFYCADACGKPGQENTDFAYTEERDPNGVIRLCLPNGLGPTGQLTYLSIHELVHAQQLCNLQDDSHQKLVEGREQCCAIEREAYMVQCKALAEDGILARAGVSIDMCASGGANGSCSKYATNGESACTTDTIDTDAMWKKVNGAMQEMLDEGKLQVPTSCAEVITNLDRRAKAQVASLPLACTPSCIAEYNNTIGNNFCFTGQCLEQSLEWQRIIPGRMTLTSGDEAYPWDACAEPDPQYGKFFSPPALTAPLFPRYNPERLYEELDRALCQINGLPALTPPFLCAFQSQRRLNLPIEDFIGISQSLLEQSDEAQIPAAGLRVAASGIGARKANELLFGYLERGMKSFAEILQVTDTILQDISGTTFPSAMCPRNAGDQICNEFTSQ